MGRGCHTIYLCRLPPHPGLGAPAEHRGPLEQPGAYRRDNDGPVVHHYLEVREAAQKGQAVPGLRPVGLADGIYRAVALAHAIQVPNAVQVAVSVALTLRIRVALTVTVQDVLKAGAGAGFPSKRGHCDLTDRACHRFLIAPM